MPVKKLESRIKNQELRVKKPKAPSLRANKVSEAISTKKKIATSSPAARPRNDKMSIPVYSLSGRAAGTMSLPEEIFGVKVNKKLLAQALRVYMTNQKSHPGSTKTRGEVRGSTAKIYRQKGTGRARHGAKKAPIFVGGGIVFGPIPRKVRLDLPRKMKKAALRSALSDKAGDMGVLGITGLEKVTGKTKEIAKFMYKVLSIMYKGKEKNKKTNALIITGEKQDNVVRGVRNIPGVDVLPASQINAYEVLKHQVLFLTKESVDVILEMNEVRTPEPNKKENN